MKTAEWTKIVFIEIVGEKREYVRISNTRDAARCLLEKWPKKTTKSYKHAVVGCSRALKGLISDEIARIFLVEAAKEANFTFSVTAAQAAPKDFADEIAEITRQLIAHEQAQMASLN